MQKKVYFKTANDVNLCGILSNPKEDESVDIPVVILCHGFTTSKDSFTNISFENALTKDGIAIFRFDFFGHGESEGNFEDITVTQGVQDILSAHRYLKSLGYEKIGLEGSSYGGAVALLAAVDLTDIFALALKCPVSDYEELEIERKGEEGLKEWKEQGFEEYESGDGRISKVNYSFFEDLKNNNGLEIANEILAPTLIVHGDDDKDVPIKQSEKISKLIPNCRLKAIEDADHKFTKEEDFKKMVKLISEFIIDKAK